MTHKITFGGRIEVHAAEGEPRKFEQFVASFDCVSDNEADAYDEVDEALVLAFLENNVGNFKRLISYAPLAIEKVE